MTNGLKMKHFILNPFKDDCYGAASRIALQAYLLAIKPHNQQLAVDLTIWLECAYAETGEEEKQQENDTNQMP